MQVKKQQLELDLEQLTGSKLGKTYDKVVYCHPAYLAYMQSTSYKMPVGCITSKNQDCQENYQHLRYAGDTTLIRTGKPGVAKSWR